MNYQISWQDDEPPQNPRVRWAYCSTEDDAKALARKLDHHDDVTQVEILADPDRATVRRVSF